MESEHKNELVGLIKWDEPENLMRSLHRIARHESARLSGLEGERWSRAATALAYALAQLDDEPKTGSTDPPEPEAA